MSKLLDRLRALPAQATPEPRVKVSMLDRLGRTSVAVPDHLLINEQPTRNVLGRTAVGHSRDLQRVLELPRRTLDPKDDSMAKKWTSILRSHDTVPCSCYAKFGFCIKDLLPLQGWGLEEASKVSGLLGLLAVSAGKTGIDILAPMVVPNCKVAVLFIPPNLRAQFFQKDYPQWSRHFNVPNLAGGRFFRPGVPVLHVVAYSELSSAKSTDLLKKIQPDLIIGDECHLIARRSAARTSRFLRYCSQAKGTRFLGLSGTLTNRSLEDYAHLAKLALGEGSPLPLHWPTVEEWAGAIDAEKPNKLAAPIGALRKLCEPGEHVRDGFRRRLIQTPGVVASEQGAVGMSLVISTRKVVTPSSITNALAHVRLTWQRPDGEELTDAMTKAAVCRQLASGFYYRWIWPRGESKEVIKTWLDARREWHKELREKLKYPRDHMDSPLLLTRAAIKWHDGFVDIDPQTQKRTEYPPHTKHRMTWDAQAWLAWKAVKDSAEPQTEAVWVDDYLIQDAIKWGFQEPGLIWYDHAAFGERLASLSDIPFYGPGTEASEKILSEKGTRTVIVSLKAHGTGKNLQAWHRSLFCCAISSGKDAEQCLDAQTEVLTNKGWLKKDESPEGLLFAAYDITDGSIHWSPGERVERALGEEPMYGICNPHLDIRVTAGHRMVVQGVRRMGNGGCDGYYYKPAEFMRADALPQRNRLLLNGEQEASGAPLTDSDLLLLGMLMTDGHIGQREKRFSLFQSDRYPEVIEEIDRALVASRLRHHKSVMRPVGHVNNYGVRKHTLYRWYVARGRKAAHPDLRGWEYLDEYVDRDCPEAFEKLTKDQLWQVLRGMWLGNGSKNRGTYAYDLYTPHTMDVCTGHHVMAERIQSLCVRRGIRCNLSQPAENTWVLHISEDTSWTTTTLRLGDGRPLWGVVPSSPEERVWCVSVDSGAIVIRRNGKVAVVGNCLGRTHRLGQRSDEVTASIYRHTPEMDDAWKQAERDAKYIAETTGVQQKLIYASRVEE